MVTYFKIVLNSHSRSKQSWRRFITRLPTRKLRNCRFLFFSTFNSLMHCNWDKFVTCVPQHILLSIPSMVITRISPTWSLGRPLVARVIYFWDFQWMKVKGMIRISRKKQSWMSKSYKIWIQMKINRRMLKCMYSMLVNLPLVGHLFHPYLSKHEQRRFLMPLLVHYTYFQRVRCPVVINSLSDRFRYRKLLIPTTRTTYQCCILVRIWPILNVDLK